MRLSMVLLMIMCLSLTPLASQGRNIEKYTPKYNAYVSKSLGEEIYKFVKTVEHLENTWEVRRHIIVNIFKIIDKYSCNGKLYIINRGLTFGLVKNNVRYIRILIYVMTAVRTIDIITLELDVESVKRGEPIKTLEFGRTSS